MDNPAQVVPTAGADGNMQGNGGGSADHGRAGANAGRPPASAAAAAAASSSDKPATGSRGAKSISAAKNIIVSDVNENGFELFLSLGGTGSMASPAYNLRKELDVAVSKGGDTRTDLARRQLVVRVKRAVRGVVAIHASTDLDALAKLVEEEEAAEEEREREASRPPGLPFPLTQIEAAKQTVKQLQDFFVALHASLAAEYAKLPLEVQKLFPRHPLYFMKDEHGMPIPDSTPGNNFGIKFDTKEWQGFSVGQYVKGPSYVHGLQGKSLLAACASYERAYIKYKQIADAPPRPPILVSIPGSAERLPENRGKVITELASLVGGGESVTVFVNCHPFMAVDLVVESLSAVPRQELMVLLEDSGCLLPTKPTAGDVAIRSLSSVTSTMPTRPEDELRKAATASLLKASYNNSTNQSVFASLRVVVVAEALQEDARERLQFFFHAVACAKAVGTTNAVPSPAELTAADAGLVLIVIKDPFLTAHRIGMRKSDWCYNPPVGKGYALLSLREAQLVPNTPHRKLAERAFVAGGSSSGAGGAGAAGGVGAAALADGAGGPGEPNSTDAGAAVAAADEGSSVDVVPDVPSSFLHSSFDSGLFQISSHTPSGAGQSWMDSAQKEALKHARDSITAGKPLPILCVETQTANALNEQARTTFRPTATMDAAMWVCSKPKAEGLSAQVDEACAALGLTRDPSGGISQQCFRPGMMVRWFPCQRDVPARVALISNVLHGKKGLQLSYPFSNQEVVVEPRLIERNGAKVTCFPFELVVAFTFAEAASFGPGKAIILAEPQTADCRMSPLAIQSLYLSQKDTIVVPTSQGQKVSVWLHEHDSAVDKTHVKHYADLCSKAAVASLAPPVVFLSREPTKKGRSKTTSTFLSAPAPDAMRDLVKEGENILFSKPSYSLKGGSSKDTYFVAPYIPGQLDFSGVDGIMFYLLRSGVPAVPKALHAVATGPQAAVGWQSCMTAAALAEAAQLDIDKPDSGGPAKLAVSRLHSAVKLLEDAVTAKSQMVNAAAVSMGLESAKKNSTDLYQLFSALFGSGWLGYPLAPPDEKPLCAAGGSSTSSSSSGQPSCGTCRRCSPSTYANHLSAPSLPSDVHSWLSVIAATYHRHLTCGDCKHVFDISVVYQVAKEVAAERILLSSADGEGMDASSVAEMWSLALMKALRALEMLDRDLDQSQARVGTERRCPRCKGSNLKQSLVLRALPLLLAAFLAWEPAKPLHSSSSSSSSSAGPAAAPAALAAVECEVLPVTVSLPAIASTRMQEDQNEVEGADEGSLSSKVAYGTICAINLRNVKKLPNQHFNVGFIRDSLDPRKVRVATRDTRLLDAGKLEKSKLGAQAIQQEDEVKSKAEAAAWLINPHQPSEAAAHSVRVLLFVRDTDLWAPTAAGSVSDGEDSDSEFNGDGSASSAGASGGARGVRKQRGRKAAAKKSEHGGDDEEQSKANGGSGAASKRKVEVHSEDVSTAAAKRARVGQMISAAPQNTFGRARKTTAIMRESQSQARVQCDSGEEDERGEPTSSSEEGESLREDEEDSESDSSAGDGGIKPKGWKQGKYKPKSYANEKRRKENEAAAAAAAGAADEEDNYQMGEH